jgi:hypothetical protein
MRFIQVENRWLATPLGETNEPCLRRLLVDLLDLPVCS